MQQTATVQINRVLGVSEETPPGKNYTVYQFQCEGFINGQPVDTFIAKTLSTKIANEIKAGTFTQYNAELDVFKGNTSYKVPKSYYSNDQQGSGFKPVNTPPANTAPAWGAKPAPAPVAPQGFSQHPEKYTLDDLKNLYADLYAWVGKNISGEKEVLTSATATLFIQATRINLKAQHPAVAQVAKAFSAPAPTGMAALLQSKGLAERVAQAEVPMEVLEEWLANADGNENRFAMEANAQLTANGF